MFKIKCIIKITDNQQHKNNFENYPTEKVMLKRRKSHGK